MSERYAPSSLLLDGDVAESMLELRGKCEASWTPEMRHPNTPKPLPDRAPASLGYCSLLACVIIPELQRRHSLGKVGIATGKVAVTHCTGQQGQSTCGDLFRFVSADTNVHALPQIPYRESPMCESREHVQLQHGARAKRVTFPDHVWGIGIGMTQGDMRVLDPAADYMGLQCTVAKNYDRLREFGIDYLTRPVFSVLDYMKNESAEFRCNVGDLREAIGLPRAIEGALSSTLGLAYRE